MEIYRHGDLLIIKDKQIKKINHKKVKENFLLEGEVTGHAHRINGAEIFKSIVEANKDNDYYLGFFDIKKEGALTHEEHKTIILTPGTYKFYQQREYDEQEERAVID